MVVKTIPFYIALTLAFVVFAPSNSHAQTMDFAAEDTSLKTAVVLMKASGFKVKTRKRLVGQIADAVSNFGGYRIISSKELMSEMGRRSHKNMGRCPKPDCYLKAVSETSLDRIMLIAAELNDGIATIEIEINDVPGQAAMNFAVAVTDDLGDPAFLDVPISELLSLQEPTFPTASPQFRDTENGRGGGNEDKDDGEPLVFDTIWAYSAIGTGVGLFALGGFFGLQADNAQAQIQESPHPREDLEALIADGESFQSYANIAFGLGLAAFAAGAVFWYLGPEEGTQNSSASSDNRGMDINIDVGPTGVGVRIPY